MCPVYLLAKAALMPVWSCGPQLAGCCALQTSSWPLNSMICRSEVLAWHIVVG